MDCSRLLWTVIALYVSGTDGAFKAGDNRTSAGHEYNRMLLASIKQPHDIVYPQQLGQDHLSGISTRKQKLRHHGTHEHIQRLTLHVALGGTQYEIRLTRNEVILSAGTTIKEHAENNQQLVTKTTENCYYHGHVPRDKWSSAAVSTCDGVRGVINVHNQTYVIQPLVRDYLADKPGHPHVVFKSSFSNLGNCGNIQGQWTPYEELYVEELLTRTKFVHAHRNQQPVADTPMKLLRIALVLDKSMSASLELRQQDDVQYVMGVANMVDLYYRELGFEVALTYLESWNLYDLIPLGMGQRALLSRFWHFQKTKLPLDVFDVAFLVTGNDLDDKLVGFSVPDSICTDRAIAVFKGGDPLEPQQTATILSHMAGHVLGMGHDGKTAGAAKWRHLYHEDTCVCTDGFGCIMSSQVVTAVGQVSRMFTTCSKSDLDLSLQIGLSSCLWGSPQVKTDLSSSCGNGVRERGEECDCGTIEECQATDPCCDSTTCFLQAWAQCRSGMCCSNCLFVPSSQMCRPRQSECDVPEFCDGQSGECPVDKYIQDGHSCSQGQGYCMAGVCPSLHRQCQQIWGAGSMGGHSQCFQRLNPTGNFNGHCGHERRTGRHLKCQHSDVLCGLLHCEGGNSSPIEGSGKDFSSISVKANNMEFECKTIHGHAMKNMPHMGMVQDGTKCGQNRICLDNTCMQLANVPTAACPSTDAALTCSNHGVCAPSVTCLCDHGWEGRDCSVRANIPLVREGSPNATPTQGALSKTVDVQVVDLSQMEGGLDRRGHLISETYTPGSSRVIGGVKSINSGLLVILLGTLAGVVFLAVSITCIRYKGKLSWRGIQKRLPSPEGTEMSELPQTPPVISSKCLPEKDAWEISSSQHAALKYDPRTTSPGGLQRDLSDGVERSLYANGDDVEAEEICKIFHGEKFDHLHESASFDFFIPPPPIHTKPLAGYFLSPNQLQKVGQLGSRVTTSYDLHQKVGQLGSSVTTSYDLHQKVGQLRSHVTTSYDLHQQVGQLGSSVTTSSDLHQKVGQLGSHVTTSYDLHQQVGQLGSRVTTSSDLHQKVGQLRSHVTTSYDLHQQVGQLGSSVATSSNLHENFCLLHPQQVPVWHTPLSTETCSPPRTLVARHRNMADFMQQLNSRATIYLSPSPDDLPNHQLSPSTSTSDDVRSSEAEAERMYRITSYSDHSPTSLFSSSSQLTTRQSFGSLSQYLLKPHEASRKADSVEDTSDVYGENKSLNSSGGHSAHGCDQQPDQGGSNNLRTMSTLNDDSLNLDMPPSMIPLSMRSIFGLGHSPDPNVAWDTSSDNNCYARMVDSQHGSCEKSSGYGSELEHEVFSIGDASQLDPRCQSAQSSWRTQSSLPTSYSTVIRTGPNRIQLVPARQLLPDDWEIEGVQQELNRLLQNLPHIDGGALHSNGGPLPASRSLNDELMDSVTAGSLDKVPVHYSQNKSKWSSKAKGPISQVVQANIDRRSETVQVNIGGRSSDSKSEEMEPLILASRRS